MQNSSKCTNRSETPRKHQKSAVYIWIISHSASILRFLERKSSNVCYPAVKWKLISSLRFHQILQILSPHHQILTHLILFSFGHVNVDVDVDVTPVQGSPRQLFFSGNQDRSKGPRELKVQRTSLQPHFLKVQENAPKAKPLRFGFCAKTKSACDKIVEQ